MTTESMNVHQALVELKTLDKRIDAAIHDTKWIVANKHSTTKISGVDLKDYIEIAHADPYVPTLSMSKVFREELPDKIGQRIFVYERASQFDLLSENPKTFMWVSPASQQILDRYNLVQRVCEGNKKTYKDVLIYHKGYRLSKLDKDFITALCEARRKFLK